MPRDLHGQDPVLGYSHGNDPVTGSTQAIHRDQRGAGINMSSAAIEIGASRDDLAVVLEALGIRTPENTVYNITQTG